MIPSPRPTLSFSPYGSSSNMTATDPLDFTPEFTMSTVQFENEILNVVVSSLLAVLIIANIGSAVSKLVYFSRGKDFCYRSWIRAYIFANSDDPLRLLSWISRNYAYRKREWTRHPNKLHWSRLAVPLLARGLILVVTIVSIGITVPAEKRLSGCSRGDYALTLNEAKAQSSDLKNIECLDIPLSSRRGKLLVRASYCTCFVVRLGGGEPSINVTHNTVDGSIEWLLSNGSKTTGSRTYVEWKQEGVENVFRSQLSRTISIDSFMRVVVAAVEDGLEQDCGGPTKALSDRSRSTPLTDCNFRNLDIFNFNSWIESYMRNALQWEKKPTLQPRVQITDQDGWKEQSDCVTDIVVSRPVVNILPLLITLIALFIVNLAVTLAVSKHGNALDTGFHIIKEVLGHDCTSNPLEENVERGEVMGLPLRCWRCRVAGAHVGFVGRSGDIPIEGFKDASSDAELIVCGCSRVREEVERADMLRIDISSQASESLSSSMLQSQALPPPPQLPRHYHIASTE